MTEKNTDKKRRSGQAASSALSGAQRDRDCFARSQNAYGDREEMSIVIIKETRSWIAVHKPAGIAVQTRKVGMTDLESELLKLQKSRMSETQQAGKATGNAAVPYLAVIHRLDQPVEGIVLFAKNAAAAASLSGQMQQQHMTKEYLACVHRTGALGSEDGGDEWHVLEDYLVKDGRTNCSRVVSPGTSGARKAVLEYRVMEISGDTALLAVRLHTGRHHQIRVQLSHAGLPIVGDRKYGRGSEGAGSASGGDHDCEDSFPALCAHRLTFRDPDTGRKTELKTVPLHRRLRSGTCQSGCGI